MKKFFASIVLSSFIGMSLASAHHGHEGHEMPTPPEGTSPLCPIHFEQQNLCAEIIFLQAPTVGVSSDFRITFFALDEEGFRRSVDATNVFVDLWMSMGSHGHGAPPLTHERLSSEEWLLKDVYFVMAGAWQVRVQLNGEQAIVSVHAQK